MTKVINFFGGPGIGKSTIAAKIYAELSSMGYLCEIVNEFAKELAWAGRIDDLKDQLYVFGEQNHRQNILIGKADFVIVDGSILLSGYYNKHYKSDKYLDTYFDEFIIQIFNKYDNINYLITRDDSDEYKEHGRVQTEEAAKKVDVEMKNYLDESRINYKEISRNDTSSIINDIIKNK